jgi:hypothetical protein
MISNERSWPQRQPARSPRKYFQDQPAPRMAETTLKQSELAIERKTFVVALKENPRGRFLRIVENGGSQFASIIVPDSGLKDFQRLLAEMVDAAEKLPAKPTAPPPT